MISTVRSSILSILSGATAMRIVTEGENFEVKSLTDYPYARFTLSPRQSVLNTIGPGGIIEERGLASITCWYSRNTNTVGEALEDAEAIVAAFAPDVEVTDGEQLVTEVAWIESIRHESTCFGVPIFVRFRNFNF